MQDLSPHQRYRLVGVGLSNFYEAEDTRYSQRFSSEIQSAAAALGCCFIISSIPFFISLAVGSALCVPTIQV